MPDYGWNETAGRYINLDTGQFISSTTVRDALESVMDASAIRMNNITEQLTKGEISVAQWQGAMMQQIKVTHTAAAASANGGWAQMTQSDWGFTGRLIRTQYERLDKFATQIANGEQPLDGRLFVRADMYAQASRGTYEAQRQRHEVLIGGVEEERRILEKDGANCAGCLDQADLGWQPVGTLDPIGAEECLTNCVIGETFIESPEIEIAYKRLYSGRMLTLQTERGKHLTITPNHPLLTNHGWVVANKLKKGDSLICGSMGKWVSLVYPNVYDSPSMISDVFTSLGFVFVNKRIVIMPMDFDGDGMNGYVNIVLSNRFLMRRFIATVLKPSYEKCFTLANICFSAIGSFFESLRSVFRPLARASRFFGQSLFIFDAHSIHTQDIRFFNSSGFDATSDKPVMNSAPTNPKFKAQNIFTLTRDITLDNIINISSREVMDIHVYNLQTKTGWYISNGIITHNCRCEFEYRKSGELVTEE